VRHRRKKSRRGEGLVCGESRWLEREVDDGALGVYWTGFSHLGIEVVGDGDG
jgi:hypothetical protein